MKIKRAGFFRGAIYEAYDKKKPVRSFFQKIIRVIYFSIKSFFRNECYLKSSLLTFYSLISIVPLLAIIFSIAKGFGFEDFLKKEILSTFKEQEDVIATAMRFAYAFIGHIKSEAILGIGILFLFFSVFGLFENIEKTLNDIWNVKKYRGFIRRSINYITALIVFPVFFIASTGITLFIHSEILNKFQNYEFLKYFSDYVLPILKFAPYVLMCVLFSFIYIYTPNTKIHFKSRIVAGILAGAFFQFWQVIYIGFQLYLSSYNVIYGSFAALPLFLIWMQVNFLIFLFGAEIAAQMENDRFFIKSSSEDCFRMIDEKHLILLVLHGITGHFIRGEGPISIEQVSKYLGISVLDARGALHVLEKAKIIVEVQSWKGYVERYQLIVNPELFKVQEINRLVDKQLLKYARSKETPTLFAVNKYFDSFEKLIKDAGSDLNLKDFAGS